MKNRFQCIVIGIVDLNMVKIFFNTEVFTNYGGYDIIYADKIIVVLYMSNKYVRVDIEKGEYW